MKDFFLVPSDYYKKIINNHEDIEKKTDAEVVYSKNIDSTDQLKRSVAYKSEQAKTSTEKILQDNNLDPEIALNLFKFFKKHNNIDIESKESNTHKGEGGVASIDGFLHGLPQTRIARARELGDFLLKNKIIAIDSEGYIQNIDPPKTFHLSALLRLFSVQNSSIPTDHRNQYIKSILGKIPDNYIYNNKVKSIKVESILHGGSYHNKTVSFQWHKY